MIRFLSGCASIVLTVSPAIAVMAVEPGPSAAIPSAEIAPIPAEEAKATVQWAAYLIQANLPTHYHGDKNWGETKRIYAGVDIDHDGLKLKTHRRYREVRHGKWLKYAIDLKDPTDPRHLNINVASAAMDTSGRLNLNLRIDTRVGIDARQERWNYGLQLYSVSTQGTAKLSMSLQASIGFAFDYTRIPPDVVFDPLVEKADIQLIDLEVDRISKLGSDIAHELGDLAERVIRDEYLPKQRSKLAHKLNTQIDRRRDKLRISASDWLAQQLKPAP